MANGRAQPPSRSDVERIVRQVLRELEQAQRRGGQTNGAPRRNDEKAAGGGELVLAARVVSLAVIEDRLDGVERVVVPRGAVFTPAARDELRLRRVAIASDAFGAPPAARRRVVIGVTDMKYDATALANLLAGEGVEVEIVPPDSAGLSPGLRPGLGGMVAAVEQMCDVVVERERAGLLCTPHVAAAVCLANRRPRVRAAAAYSLATIDEAMAGVGANLLVVDPRAASVFELKQMARRLASSHAVCPCELAERLN